MKKLLKQFLERESSSSIVLFAMTVIAIGWMNSPLRYFYEQFVSQFLFVINDGLMAIFFLLVGLELKRGFYEGELSSPAQIILPIVAAIGGMLVPALIYILLNYADPVNLKGWATPVATDIAFALGTLSLFGKRVPSALKLFLLALAIFDDIGAIIIIILFYSTGLSLLYLLLSILFILLLFILNWLAIRSWVPYIALGVLLWTSTLFSGIHPTIAGVVLAFFIPHHVDSAKSTMHSMEKFLQPWVAYFIMPIFALANTGFSLRNLSWDIFSSRIVLGIIFGLFVGKQIGVLGSIWLMIRLRLAKLPEQITWLQLYGVAIICGIGFTMSLFLGTLSFQSNTFYLPQIRFGVLSGSILSGIMGVIILRFAFYSAKHEE
ncbi:MAG: pH-dependent sodium/proton antiporter [uncultured bacterium]|nr:MAG: pH-dependent sodium/proton antiporter [uncultured bacterium]